MTSPRANGFTLIELMVALLVFAMLSAAGVMLLSGTVAAQAQVTGRLDDLAAVERATSLMTADLAQAVPRISRTERGTFAPAFYADGQPGKPLVQFVRAGYEDLSGTAQRSSLQKLEYWVVDGRLERRAYPLVDGSAPGAPTTMLDGVTALTLRFRDEGGGWRGDWSGLQPDLLPRAVELTLVRRSAPPIKLLFLVGPGPLPKPETVPATTPGAAGG